MATTLYFEKGAASLQFEAGGDYPANRTHEVLQVQDRTASGELQVETLGLNIERRVLAFNLMPKTDYDSLVNWFLNVVNAGAETFTMTDEYGRTGTVRIVNSILDFSETSFELYSGQLTVEYVS